MLWVCEQVVAARSVARLGHKCYLSSQVLESASLFERTHPLPYKEAENSQFQLLSGAAL